MIIKSPAAAVERSRDLRGTGAAAQATAPRPAVAGRALIITHGVVRGGRCHVRAYVLVLCGRAAVAASFGWRPFLVLSVISWPLAAARYLARKAGGTPGNGLDHIQFQLDFGA